MSHDESWRRWYRSPWPEGAFAAIGAVLFLAGAILAARQGAVEGCVILGGFTVFCAYSTVGYLRGGIGVSPSGVTVRNLAGRSAHVPWPEVAGFRIVRKASRGGHYYVLAVQCRDGRALHTAACTFPQPWRKRSWPGLKARMDHTVSTLEAIRLQRTSTLTAEPFS